MVSVPVGGAREYAVRGGGAAPAGRRGAGALPLVGGRPGHGLPRAGGALAVCLCANKTTDLRVEVSRPGRQAQAKAYAAALAADCITEDMTAEQKLRALHDALVRMCEYDVDTEQQEQPDGSTAPFSADQPT